MRRTPPLDELQPPPYQDEDGSPRMSCTPSDLGDDKCDLSHGSESPRHSYGKCPSEVSGAQETESFLNKGYEEDIPSDSTAVLSPEVCFSKEIWIYKNHLLQRWKFLVTRYYVFMTGFVVQGHK